MCLYVTAMFTIPCAVAGYRYDKALDKFGPFLGISVIHMVKVLGMFSETLEPLN